MAKYLLSSIATATGNVMIRKSIFSLLFVVFANANHAGAQPVHDATRGELLYSTHCIACHSTQVLWRDKALVTDWAGLQSEVRRWQEFTGLGWSNQDIAEVTRYLNALYYRYPASD